MKTYELKVRHDKGTYKIRVSANDEQAAKQRLMNAEGCPECAIVKIKEVDTERYNIISSNKKLLNAIKKATT